nr:GapR family DNA-binding domain-containing protein [Sphingomonas endophytica]
MVGFIRRVKAHMDEVAEINEVIAAECKEAKSRGFDGTKIREVARWLRKIDKHGREKVDEAEAIFDLYRSVVGGGEDGFDAMMDSARDRALLAMFAPDDQVEKKLDASRKSMQRALALAAGAKAARNQT